jgi:hypothetical protein
MWAGEHGPGSLRRGEEIIMVELSKLGKVRVLIVGLLLVKLALLFSFYDPLLWRSSPAGTAAQPAAHSAPSHRPASDTAFTSQPDSPMPFQTESASLTPAPQSIWGSETLWSPVKQLAASLEQQRAALASKEAQLRQEQEQLALLKTALREEIEELATMRLRVNEALKKKAEIEEEELKRLARVYEATVPEQSSTLLGKLDAKLAARILARMNGPKAGKILSTMEPTQAARVSEYLAKKE